MRIAIAGSSGLIGTALVSALRQADHEVRRLVRRRPGAPDEHGWDPPAGRIDDGALDGVDAVVNLCGANAGARRWTGAFKQEIRDSRVEPTDVLARAVAERGIPVLVNASGVDYYGDTGDAVVDESAPNGSGFLPDVCRDWEAATSPASAAGARVVLLRTGLVLARSSPLLKRMLPLFRLFLGGRLGSGRQYMPWIAMEDEIGAIRFLIEHGDVAGPVNLVGPSPVTNAELTRELAEVLHRPAPWVIPEFALRVVVGEQAVLGLAGRRAIPKALQAAGYQFVHRSVHTALRAAMEG